MKKTLTIAAKIGAGLAGVAVFLTLLLLPAASTDEVALQIAKQAAAEATREAFLEYQKHIAAANTSGDHSYASLIISDASGVTTTPLDGGLYTVLAGTPMAAGEADGSCITASATTGLFTVARCGRGDIELLACVPNFFGGNTAKTTLGSWQRIRAGTTTEVGVVMRRTEVVDAGAQANMGCSPHVVSANEADTYNFAFATSGTTGEANVTRQAYLIAKKIVSR